MIVNSFHTFEVMDSSKVETLEATPVVVFIGEEHLEDVQWEPAVSVFGTTFGKSIPGQYRMYRGRETRRITCQASQLRTASY